MAGLRALVTGGTSGFGLAAARLMRDQGARVAVLDPGTSGTDGFTHVRADVTDDAAVRAAVVAATDDLGGLDVLVNSAGTTGRGGMVDNDDREWHRVLDVNVLGMVRVTRAALPTLRASRQASIVNACSAAATPGLPAGALNSASMGAVLSLTQALAAELMSAGIRVNAVNPGIPDRSSVRRSLAAADPLVRLAVREAHHRLGLGVTAHEVAAAIAFLASPLSGSTTGTCLAVEGGMAGLSPRRR